MNLKEHFKAQLMRLISEEEIKPEMPRVSWHEAIRDGLGGEGALRILRGIEAGRMSPGDYSDRLYQLHDHLKDSGVDINNPHMLRIANLAAEAKHIAYRDEMDKSIFRAGK